MTFDPDFMSNNLTFEKENTSGNLSFLDLGSYYATRKGSYMVHSELFGTGSYSSLKLLLL